MPYQILFFNIFLFTFTFFHYLLCLFLPLFINYFAYFLPFYLLQRVYSHEVFYRTRITFLYDKKAIRTPLWGNSHRFYLHSFSILAYSILHGLYVTIHVKHETAVFQDKNYSILKPPDFHEKILNY